METGAVVVLAGVMLFGGLLAALAGTYGLRRSRRVSATGVRVPALVKRRPGQPGDEPTTLLQFVTEDDRVMEVACPFHPGRRHPLHDGDTLLISYDPAEPRDVVVQGHEALGRERAFLVGGMAVALLSLVLLVVAIAAL
ncbi:DUF3592 domain-containing protein [Streptomyces sp. NPDC014870]|uniref:DUF3592 domain-containing protein n=1 Tax=Streptomyces sp. NPDC014870 TaxID=3364925 RepID=UPI0036F85D94